MGKGAPDVAKGRSHYLALDAARGIAASAVVIYHLRDLLGVAQLFGGSFLAVDLFFLMSGFVIALTYEGRLRDGKMSFIQFGTVRAIRLYPLYLFASGIGFTYFLLKIVMHAPVAPTPGQLGLAASTAAFILPSIGSGSWGFGIYPFAPSAWSLTLEFWLNLVYALTVVRLGPKGLTVLALVALGAMIQQALMFNSLDLGWGLRTFYGGFTRFCFSFTVGLLIFRWSVGKSPPAAPLWIMLPVTFAFVAFPHDAVVLQLVWVVIVFPAFLILSLRARLAGAIAKVADHLGRLSYGVYILHAPLALVALGFFKTVDRSHYAQDGVVAGLAILALVIAVTAAATYWFDEPVRRWLQRNVYWPMAAKNSSTSSERV